MDRTLANLLTRFKSVFQAWGVIALQKDGDGSPTGGRARGRLGRGGHFLPSRAVSPTWAPVRCGKETQVCAAAFGCFVFSGRRLELHFHLRSRGDGQGKDTALKVFNHIGLGKS